MNAVFMCLVCACISDDVSESISLHRPEGVKNVANVLFKCQIGDNYNNNYDDTATTVTTSTTQMTAITVITQRQQQRMA